MNENVSELEQRTTCYILNNFKLTNKAKNTLTSFMHSFNKDIILNNNCSNMHIGDVNDINNQS